MPLSPEERSRRDRRWLRRLARDLDALSSSVDLLWTCFLIPALEHIRTLQESLPKVKPPEGDTLDEVIYKAIRAAILATGSQRGAAKLLKVDEGTVRNRLAKWEKMGILRAGAEELPKGKSGRPPGT